MKLYLILLLSLVSSAADVKDRLTVKSYFEQGDTPKAAEYGHLIDSLYATVNTINDLVAINTSDFSINFVKIRVLGRSAVNDGGGGDFIWTSTSELSTNEFVFAPITGPGRWFIPSLTYVASRFYLNAANNVFLSSGNGSPEGVIPAGVGSAWVRLDGTSGQEWYFKTNGTDNVGWSCRNCTVVMGPPDKGGGGETNATYVVGNSTNVLPNALVLTAGAGISVSKSNGQVIITSLGGGSGGGLDVQFIDPLKLYGTNQVGLGFDTNTFKLNEQGELVLVPGLNMKINQVRSPDGNEEYNFLSYLAVRNSESVVRERDVPFYRDVYLGDETTSAVVNTNVFMCINTVNWTLESVKATLNTPQIAGATFTLQVWQGYNGVWTPVLSTPMTLDNGVTNTISSDVRAVIGVPLMTNNAVLRFGITQVGDGTAKGAKVFLKGKHR